jgi:peptide/nickel transport system permease protein
MLFLTATALSFACGFLAGKMLAWRRGSRSEVLATVGGITLYTVFTPWLALWLLWLFAYVLRIFPVGKFITYELWSADAPNANAVFVQMLLAAAVVVFSAWAILRRTDSLASAAKRNARIISFAVVLPALGGYWILTRQAIYALDILYHMALPVLTLTLVSFGGTMLLTRNSMLETLGEDYLLTARAKGLPENEIRDRRAPRFCPSSPRWFFRWRSPSREG